MSLIAEIKSVKSGKEKLREFRRGGFIFFGLAAVLLLNIFSSGLAIAKYLKV